MCFNGINYQSCHVRTSEKQSSPTLLGCSSQPRFQIPFKNISGYFAVFCILLLDQPPILPLMENIATMWEGRTVSLLHTATQTIFSTLSMPIVNFPCWVGCFEQPSKLCLTHLFIYKPNRAKWTEMGWSRPNGPKRI